MTFYPGLSPGTFALLGPALLEELLQPEEHAVGDVGGDGALLGDRALAALEHAARLAVAEVERADGRGPRVHLHAVAHALAHLAEEHADRGEDLLALARLDLGLGPVAEALAGLRGPAVARRVELLHEDLDEGGGRAGGRAEGRGAAGGNVVVTGEAGGEVEGESGGAAEKALDLRRELALLEVVS